LEEILEDLLEQLEPQAAAAQIRCTSHLVANVQVNGDASQLVRLFANLLDNALKYTPSGGTVTLAMTPMDGMVMVRVEDTGIGIAPEHLERVFDRFWRADAAREREQGGLGLGLAIAQAIAQQHGGEIRVTSQIGTGSCFQVRLPLA